MPIYTSRHIQYLYLVYANVFMYMYSVLYFSYLPRHTHCEFGCASPTRDVQVPSDARASPMGRFVYENVWPSANRGLQRFRQRAVCGRRWRSGPSTALLRGPLLTGFGLFIGINSGDIYQEKRAVVALRPSSFRTVCLNVDMYGRYIHALHV